MKFDRKRIALIAIITIFCCLFGSCAKKNKTLEERPLFDENGMYIEENFLFNSALEKDGAHLIVDGKTEYCIRYEDTTDESVLTAVNELKSYFDTLCGGIDVKAGDSEGKAIRIGKYGYTPPAPLKKTGAYIVEIGENDVLLSFEEKPEHPKSNWCTPPFYFYKREDARRIREAIADGCGTDAPGSLVAWMCRHAVLHSMEMPGSRYDIGNLESYEAVQKNYKGITKK